jgi:chromosome segregation ATPase
MVEQTLITTALQEYNITDAAIAQYKQDFMVLSVKGIDDRDGYDLCHSARMEVKGKRVEVEKTRKKLKEDALEYGRVVDKEAKRITSLLEPIENYLLSQEKIIDDEKERIKKAEELARIEAENAAKRAEEERLEKIRQEQEIERKRLDAIAEEQRQKEAAIKAEQEAIEKEKQRIANEKRRQEEEKLRQEQFEKEKALAVERAKQEEATRIKREAEQKAEKERLAKLETERKEALKPDKDKVVNYLNGIMKYMSENCPAVKDKTVYNLLVSVEGAIEKTCDSTIKRLEGI